MMNEIPPTLAADLAKEIYDLVDKEKPISKVLADMAKNYGEVFEVGYDHITRARTGGPGLIKCETAFGMMVYGTGEFYKRHAFIVLRGSRILGDWLTNANFALTSRSAAGHPVHDGFYQAFKSFRAQLDRFIAGFGSRGIATVHCVGHSLGGGLATLCSEYLRQCTNKEIYLYSFGAPRVGFARFSDFLTRGLGAERIFRMYHRTDIVPCMPPWPYAHVPSLMSEMHDYFQPSPGSVPSPDWHSMDSYLKTINGDSWAQLRGKRFEPFDDQATEVWLNYRSPIHFNNTDLAKLDKAIWYVLRKCLQTLGGVASFFTSPASDFSIYDTVAFVMHRAVVTARIAAGAASSIPLLVKALIRKICGLLGITDSDKTDRRSIRALLQSLSVRLKQYCREAIDRTLMVEV